MDFPTLLHNTKNALHIWHILCKWFWLWTNLSAFVDQTGKINYRILVIANSKCSSWLSFFHCFTHIFLLHFYWYWSVSFFIYYESFFIISLPVIQSRVYALFSVYTLRRRRTYWVCTLLVQLASMATRTTVYFASHVTGTDQWNKCT